MYASAAWGHHKYSKCETIQHRAMRTILGVGRITPVGALYGDLDWIPMHIKQRLEVLKFAKRIHKMQENRLTKTIFQHEHKNCTRSPLNIILQAANIDVDNIEITDQVIKCVFDSEMRLFHQKLERDMQDMSRLSVYREIKSGFQLEKYVLAMRDRKQRSLFAKARMGVLPIKIETGRYRGILRCERLCQFCDQKEVEDESHFMFHCPKYDIPRRTFYSAFLPNDISNENDMNKFKLSLATDNHLHIYATAKYLQCALQLRSNSAS